MQLWWSPQYKLSKYHGLKKRDKLKSDRSPRLGDHVWQQQHQQELEAEVEAEEQLQDRLRDKHERQLNANDWSTTHKCRKTCTTRGLKWTVQG